MTADTAIFFDLDGTLVQFTRPYEDVLADVFEAHLGGSSPDLIEAYDEAFFGAFGDLEPEPYRRGMEAVLEVADEEEPTADANAEPAKMVATLREREYAATEFPKAARSAVEQLSEQASLGVVTNGLPAWQAGKLEHHGVVDLFDAVVTSYEAGAHKPDSAPFELARERIPADEYAMVGDDYECDVEGARAAGFVPVHFEEGGARRAPESSSGEGSEPRDGDEGDPGFWETLSIMV